ncbi:ester cyclase [Actinomadura yumaensis]|uniref:ester cyclase n=1 Tax=Actinomadura yumaensis TaxID=111807 RepID=UPI0036221594
MADGRLVPRRPRPGVRRVRARLHAARAAGGAGGPRRSVRRIRSAFAGLTIAIDLQVAEGDLVATHFTACGEHVGEYRGIAPTGRSVTASGVQIWTVRGGRAVADLNVFDEWGMVEQLRAP